MYKVLAIVVLVLSIIASYFIFSGGYDIGIIRSVGRSTLEEAYYQALGGVYRGFSLFVFAAGVFFSSVLYRFQEQVESKSL